MLYHYTDFAAFDGIIRCAELRLNNILNMNDASEMRLFMNGICKAVIARLKADKEQDKIYKLETFFQNEMEEEFHYSAYAACFSKYRDDAAQWERYGKFGQGVCIAFHEDILRRMLGGSISLQKVFYQEDMGEHHLVDEFYKLISASSKLAEILPTLQNLINAAISHVSADIVFPESYYSKFCLERHLFILFLPCLLIFRRSLPETTF